MECKIFIGKEYKEEVLVYAHEKTKLVREIENLVAEEGFELIGYKEKEAVRLNLSDISCFSVEDNKIYAFTEKERLLVKCRLYKLEETLPQSFVKINQSCIANIKKIDRFDASVSGSLTVRFKNGITDYVSRRNVKSIKERLGI